jgi:hypothetical protein
MRQFQSVHMGSEFAAYRASIGDSLTVIGTPLGVRRSADARAPASRNRRGAGWEKAIEWAQLESREGRLPWRVETQALTFRERRGTGSDAGRLNRFQTISRSHRFAGS